MAVQNPKKFSRLSDRQKAILRFIVRFMNERGYPPTMCEIGKATDITSTTVVSYNIDHLIESGYLSKTPRVSRSLRVLIKPSSAQMKVKN